ncbi:MAG: EamA family transporter [Chloroflexi bacterium]|nr:EamA family transporter [Chloroflexota bacterium]MYK62295.1 EamA family transporter [Chloroflexota bacterium]
MVRRATRPAVTTTLMAVTSAVLVLPLAIYLLIVDFPSGTGWWFILATIVLHIWYFATLGYAYNTGDLSIVYPVARGLGLAIIPILGVFVVGESMSWQAAVGAASIVTGLAFIAISDIETATIKRTVRSWLMLMRKWRAVRRFRAQVRPAWMLAILTGLVIGIYSVVDAQGVKHVQPALYMFFLQLGGGLGMMVIQSRLETREAFIDEARRHWKILVIGGLLQFAAYTLVLTALTFSPVSYVGPFREISILLAVGYGAIVLKEGVTPVRALGAICIASGGAAIALSP